ncbi:MAG: hypothetical protein HQ509_02480 [Candidatus Marinimicrobia bacterium]|nr:hypothetical protein [Candidatus Neomarinimicrobiota bacterium]
MGKKSKRLKPFVPLRIDMLDHPSYRGLSSKAKVMYSYFRKNSNGRFDEPIALPYSQLLDMFSTDTISRGFKELQDTGFIILVSKGGMYGSPSYYKLIGEFANPYHSGRKY